MLTMSIKAYDVNVVVNIKPIYLNKHVFFLTIVMESFNLLLRRKCLLKVIFKNVWVVKNLFLDKVEF